MIINFQEPKGFTTKRAERQDVRGFTTKRASDTECLHSSIRASAGREPVRGFTLIETLVAIAILMMAIVGPFYAVQQAMNASYTARDQLIAASLAQEGLEYVRSVRDDNYLYNNNPAHSSTPVNWMNALSNCRGSNTCMIDATKNAFTDASAIQICGAGGCTPLNLSATYLYTQTAGSPATRFTRSITIRDVSATEVLVTATVSWTSVHTSYTVVVTEHLNNWL